jgi:hypothetical protein
MGRRMCALGPKLRQYIRPAPAVALGHNFKYGTCSGRAGKAPSNTLIIRKRVSRPRGEGLMPVPRQESYGRSADSIHSESKESWI